VLPTGINLLGHAIIAFGTDEQKATSRILDGEIFWAQGYSEPNAGSDLASLNTRAVDDGDALSSTAKRSGRASRTSATGCSRWCAPIPRRNPGTPGSACC
jgi:alkylation response protein AidB-like acyl-CoA dehydrogenase